jgi:hypothetical protein
MVGPKDTCPSAAITMSFPLRTATTVVMTLILSPNDIGRTQGKNKGAAQKRNNERLARGRFSA